MSNNIVWHSHPVDQQIRASQKSQKSLVIWFTGLSASGKSTIAGALEQILTHQGYHTYLLDGDNVRHGLCRDLGFSDGDRKENIRRVGEVAKLSADAGLITLAAFISPFRADRRIVRDILPEGQFVEVYVK
ncbi:MAG: adenylyl-sulfate kinase, partial [Gammaproteobacteria bacterium]|nr:adenylyl-sulfate kinase [Gammaproteobacteria bacterium]